MKTLSERFEKHYIPVTETGCWLWIGQLSRDGYGRIRESAKGKQIVASRASYMLYKGEIPEAMFVCHKCDIPSCVNPNHLFLGTQKDNIHDMIMKGRRFNKKGMRKAFCKRGHERNERNLRIRFSKNGHYISDCKLCAAERYQLSKLH